MDKFFIQSDKKHIIPIHSIKDLPNLFPHYQTQVSNYIKENKIKMKEDKMVELFQYYNKLTAKPSNIPKS